MRDNVSRAGIGGRRAQRAVVMVVASAMFAACGTTPPPTAPPTTNPTTQVSLTPTQSPTATPSLAVGGYHWTAVDTEQFGGVGLAAVTSAADARLFAIGDWLMADAPDGTPRHPTTWTSSDGLTWSRLPDRPAFVSRREGWEEVVLDIAPAGGGFIAVGMEQQGDGSNADAAAWFSLDGTSWTRATVKDGTGRTMDQVVPTARGFVALGEAGYDIHGGFGAGTAIWTSPDGRTWTLLADEDAPPRGTRLRNIVAGATGFLATATFENASQGSEGTPRQPVTAGIWRSADAVHWEPIPGTKLGINDISPLADGFVAVGSGEADHAAHAIAWRSADGQTWTDAALPPPPGLPAGTPVLVERVVSGPAGLLAFGEREDDFSTVAWASPDGAAWTSLDLTPTLNDAVVDLAQAVDGSVLLSGQSSNGSADPIVWLLAP